MATNVLTLQFPFEEVEKDKKTSDKKIHEGMQSICALLNSKGGLIRLYSKKKETFNIDALVRKFEQRLNDLIGSWKCCTEFKILSGAPADGTEITFNIEGSLTLCTLNYNLYLPNETQVNLMSPREPVENVLRIVNGINIVECEELICLGSHRKNFVKGQVIDSRESKIEQFKKLKHEASKRVCLADRIVSKSNKFVCTVSAFANYRGGHIYYGIQDDGVVVGEVVKEKDMKVIMNKVKRVIQKLIWPNNGRIPERTVQWEVFFEPVRARQDGNQQIPSTFVIVVSVIHCSGGVFVENPESYHVVSGKPQAMSLEMWKKRLASNGNLHRFCNRREAAVPPSLSRCRWSSEKMEQLCLTSREKLARLRNNGDKTGFEILARDIEINHSHDNFKVIVLQQKAACSYRESNFPQARQLLAQSRNLLTLSKEAFLVVEIENFYWESLVNHSLGRTDESESRRIDGMQLMERSPADIIGAWFHFQQGRALERLVTRNCDESSSLIKKAKVCYRQALKQASELPESTGVVELKQRAHTRLAMLHLGCFFHDNKVTRRKDVDKHDLDEAERMLGIVNWSCRSQGWPMTEFCRCEYLLARAEQSYRCWQTFEDESFIQMAHEETNEALSISKQKNFQEMMGCANAELRELTCYLNK